MACFTLLCLTVTLPLKGFLDDARGVVQGVFAFCSVHSCSGKRGQTPLTKFVDVASSAPYSGTIPDALESLDTYMYYMSLDTKRDDVDFLETANHPKDEVGMQLGFCGFHSVAR